MALPWLTLRVRWRRAWAIVDGGVADRWRRWVRVAAAASARRVDGTYHTLIDEIGAPDLVVVPGCELLADPARLDPSLPKEGVPLVPV